MPFSQSGPNSIPQLRKQWDAALGQALPDLNDVLTMFAPDAKIASRAASGQALNAIAKQVPYLVGGLSRFIAFQ